MKNRKFTFALRTLLISALIAAMLAVSGGVVIAGASGAGSTTRNRSNVICKTETIEGDDVELNIGIARARDDSMLYFNASPVSFVDNYKSEILDDSVAVNVYDGYAANFIDGSGNLAFVVTLDPPVVVEGACKIENNTVSVDKENEDFINAADRVENSVAYGSCCFCYDHPEIFWIRDFQSRLSLTAKSDGNGGYNAVIDKVNITAFEAYSGAQSEITTVKNGIDTAFEAIPAGDTRYETVKNIHDYICENASYNFEAAAQSATSDAHTIAPLFNGKKTFVCEGYSKSFKVLCDRFDIPCALVIGKGNTEAHMWTYVRMDDNKWYAVDVTWDDTDPISDDYFLRGSNRFNNNHTPNGYVTVDNSVLLVFPPLSLADYNPDWNQGNSSSSSTSETSASGQTSQTSASGQTSQTSASGQTSQTSASGQTSQTSASGQTSQTSASGQTSQTSASGQTSQTSASGQTSETSASGQTSETSASESSSTQTSTTQTSATQARAKEIAVRLDNPNNGFVKSAQIPETAKAKAGNDDVALDKIRIIVTKLDDTKKKTLSDGIRKINNSYDPDNSMLEAYDIELVDGNNNTVTIIEGKVKICLAFPSDSSNNYTNYVYSVYHQKNDGSVERITPVGYNAQGVWFENDKFSPHGLVSVKKSGGDEPSPGTGETILMTVVAIILLALAACAIAFVVIRNKKSDNHDELPETDDTQSRD